MLGSQGNRLFAITGLSNDVEIVLAKNFDNVHADQRFVFSDDDSQFAGCLCHSNYLIAPPEQRIE